MFQYKFKIMHCLQDHSNLFQNLNVQGNLMY